MERSPTLAFLATDVEGSSRRWELEGEAMSFRMRMHDRLVREATAECEGRIFKGLGDGFYAVFARVADALSAAYVIRDRLAAAEWNTPDPIRLRMAIHCGTAEERDNDYFGPTVNRVARLLAIAEPGQLVLSQAAFSLLEEDLPAGSRTASLGNRRLRGLGRKERVYALSLAGQKQDLTHVAGGRPRPGRLLPPPRISLGVVLVSLLLIAVGTIGILKAMNPPRPRHTIAVPPSVGESWTQDGHDALHTGYNPGEKHLSPSHVHRLHLLWRFQTGPKGESPKVWSAVTVESGVLYVGSDDGTWAIRASNGKALWHATWTGNTEASAPCFESSGLYIGNAGGQLLAINPQSGRKEWSLETQPQVPQPAALTSPTYSAGVVYVGSFGAGVWAIRTGSHYGTELWAADAGTHTPSPTVVGDAVLVGSSEGVQALKATSGAGIPSWGTRFTAAGQIFTAPSVEGGTVFVGAAGRRGNRRRGFLYALNRHTGQRLWRFPVQGKPSVPLSQPAVALRFVYVASSRGVISRLDVSTGQRSWVYPASGVPPAGEIIWWRPAVANGVVYVGGVGARRETLQALQADSGRQLFQWVWPEAFAARAVSSSEPAIAGGRVYVSYSYNRRGSAGAAAGVYAFGPRP